MVVIGKNILKLWPKVLNVWDLPTVILFLHTQWPHQILTKKKKKGLSNKQRLNKGREILIIYFYFPTEFRQQGLI